METTTATEATLQGLKNDIKIAMKNNNPTLANRLSDEYTRLSQQGSSVPSAVPSQTPQVTPEPVPTAVPEKGLGEQIAGRFDEGAMDRAMIWTDPNADPLNKAFRDFGSRMGTGGQVMSDIVGYIIPDSWEKAAIETAKENWGKLMENQTFATYLNKTLEGSMEAYDFLQKEFPQQMKNLEATVQISEWLTPAKFRAPTRSIDPVAKVAQDIIDWGTEATMSERRRWLQEAIRKPPTSEQGRIREGLGQVEDAFGNVTRTPSNLDNDIIDLISSMDEIKPSQSATVNMGILKRKAEEEAKELRWNLENVDVRIPRTSVANRLKITIDDLKDNYMTMKGEPWKEAEVMFKYLESRIAKFNERPEALWDLRIDLDNFMEREFGRGIWDKEQQKALDVALRQIRQRLNDQLDEFVPNMGVKQSFNKQFLLKTAASRLAAKNGDEVGSRIGRSINNSLKVLDRQAGSTVRSKLGTLALFAGGATAGAASAGALASISPTVWSIFGAGIGGYGVYKVAVSPKTRLALGYTLKLTNEAINASKNAAMIETLKEDREKILEALKLPTSSYEPEELKNISEEDIKNMFDFEARPPRK